MIKVQKGIEMPMGRRGRISKYPFDTMAIGDSFFEAGGVSIQASILTCAKRKTPKKFTTKSVKEIGKQGYRCWRFE